MTRKKKTRAQKIAADTRTTVRARLDGLPWSECTAQIHMAALRAAGRHKRPPTVAELWADVAKWRDRSGGTRVV